MVKKILERFDRRAIEIIRKISPVVARISLFTVFFWFGILKIFNISPANPLVENLLEKTLPFIAFEQFIVFFSVFEMAIGVAFLIPKMERLAIALLIPHMFATAMPLILLPEITWQGFMTPTLEGQYIIKNLLIIALALGLASRLQPFNFGEKKND